MQEKLYLAIPRMKIQVKPPLLQEGEEKGQEQSWDRKQQGERRAGFSCQHESGKTGGINSFCESLFLSSQVT